MRRPGSCSLLLAVALLCTACPSTVSPSASLPAAATATGPDSVLCEFFGARFVARRAWTVEEHREPREPLSRVSLKGRVGTHDVLVSIIPREMRAAGDPTPASQARQYFDGLRAGMTEWQDVSETRFEAPTRSYPVMFGRRIVRGPLPPLDREQHDTVLLYFPDDFPRGRHFYVFFWTDSHPVGEQPNELAELRSLVDSFTILSPPPGAASRGCAAP